ncbi:MAG: tetratricopeptide repeat protein [Rhizobiales bacterium]|nr:tetratricopeptide repeat protein [Hyphomicrobiales bacterium]
MTRWLSSWQAVRTRGGAVLSVLTTGAFIVVLFTFTLGVSGIAHAGVKAEVKVTTTNGFARILITSEEEVESAVRLAGGVIVITFKQPIDLSVDRISTEAPNFISAARRDPDGRGIRLALARKVTVNSMAAAERLFVDLLPENWTGVPPGLPQDVIEDLARRAREAEKQLRQQRQVTRSRTQLQIRVRVATQPTFTRYVFELPELTAVSNDRTKDGLTLVFAAPLKFDLADAKATLPPMVHSIDTELSSDSASIKFALDGTVDIRTFREDNNYVVDISDADAKESRAKTPARQDDLSALIFDPASVKRAPLGVDPPETVPAKTPQGAARDAAQPKSATHDPAPLKRHAPSAEKEKSINPAPPEKRTEAPPATSPAPAHAASASAKSTPDRAVAQMPMAEKAAPEKPVAENPSAENSSPGRSASGPAATKQVSQSAATPQQSAPESVRAAAPGDPNAPLAVRLERQGENVRLIFPFGEPTPAAVFRRADMLWLVFDTTTRLDLKALNADTSRTMARATATEQHNNVVVRIRLERPRLASVVTEGNAWVVAIGDAVLDPTRPLGIARNIIGPLRASVTVPFDEPRELHRISDPEIGDSLLVVTALGPARGFLKTQDFVEFRALASTHGVVMQPLADDVNAELSGDKIVVSRPGGLTLSATGHGGGQSASALPAVFDPQLWGFDRHANFIQRQIELTHAAAESPPSQRTAQRLDLARFYLAHDMSVEAKAVLTVAINEDRPTAEEPTALLLHAVANILLGRTDQALKDLSNPIIGNQYDAPLWRALAYARAGRWAEARAGFKTVEKALATLPVELQRVALTDALRAAIEVGDYNGATHELHELETIGSTSEMKPMLAVLNGRLAQGLGRTGDALAAYRTAADSPDRPAAAQGRLREVLLRHELGDLKPDDVVASLETLTTLWRGDETEIEALQLLGRLYTQQRRYRDAFYVMRTALAAHPNSEMTRRIHDEASASFDTLFLAGKGDAMPAIEALSLFYDFRELTPIGRRGDEMIRRMSDRLVAVDLLNQAAELLQHQVDHRLQGAARAQVATRLAVIYMMNNKPDRAEATLRATRVSGIGNELRDLRLMLEARALSDIGRRDVALEVISNISRREAARLRSDILWAAKRFALSAEQIEFYYGERWKDFQPLTDNERADILRAAIGYALGEDKIGIDRLKEKYAAKMSESVDRRTFEIATEPIGTNTEEFHSLAKKIAAANTLNVFLSELRSAYPEIGALSPVEAGNRPANPTVKAVEPETPTAPLAPIAPTPGKGRTASR